jgi:hypothetical protein
VATLLEHMPEHSCLSIAEHGCLSYATYVTYELTKNPLTSSAYLTLGNARRGAAKR